MDINPYEYKNSFLYEFGNYLKKNDTKLILFIANWLDSDLNSDDPISTHRYWVGRLSPLLGSGCLFIACNRTGTEKGI